MFEQIEQSETPSLRSTCGGQLGKSNISSLNLEYINGLGKNSTSSVDLRDYTSGKNELLSSAAKATAFFGGVF